MTTTPPSLWLESPTNPALEVTDVAGDRRRPRRRRARRRRQHLRHSPAAAAARAWARTSSLHSATKYIAGHSDVLMGAVVTARRRAVRRAQGSPGPRRRLPGPFEAWLALRGLRTLHVRLERAQANAAELARRLAEHPAVEEVRYPGFGAIVGDRAGRAARSRRTCWSARPGCGSTRRAWAAWSRRSSGGAAGRRSPPRSPTGWCGSRSASRTSRTCGPTWPQALDGFAPQRPA